MRAGLITAVYTCRAWTKGKPQVDPVVLDSALIWLFIFCMILSRWLFQLSCGSSQALSTHADSSDFFSMLSSHMGAFMLNLLLLEKCIRVYFSGANRAPYFLAQRRHLS